MNILSDPAENAESESVRFSLGATRDLLDRAGFSPVDRALNSQREICGGTQCSTCEPCRKEWSRNANKRFQKYEKHIRP